MSFYGNHQGGSYGNYQGGRGNDSRPASGRGYGHSDRDYEDRRRMPGGAGAGHGFNRSGGNATIKHMGENQQILELLRSEKMTDRSCLEIIDPRNTDRDDLVNGVAAPISRSMPRLDSWRLETPAGVSVTDNARGGSNAHTLRSNFFRVSAGGIPNEIFHYNVSIFRYKHDPTGNPYLEEDAEDLARGSDKFLTTSAVRSLLCALDEHWRAADVLFGIAYDGNSSLYTTRRVPLPTDGALSDAYDIGHMYQHDVLAGQRRIFSLVLRYVKVIVPPKLAWSGALTQAASAEVVQNHREALQAMDVALLSFARKNLDSGQWFLSGNTVFSAAQSKQYPLTDQFIGLLGYHASFRACLSGLALVKDISVTCFLKGGSLLNFVAATLRCDVRDLRRHLHSGNRRMEELAELLKNCKVVTTHVRMHKKFRSFGAPASDLASSFTLGDAPSTTVSAYFQDRYNLSLRHPDLPTVNVGTRSRAILVPMELVDIVPGQTRSRSMTGEISGAIIKHAAMRPNDRFRALTQGSFLFPALQQDEDAQHFGVANICGTAVDGPTSSAKPPSTVLPTRIAGTILPPAKILYRDRKVIEPQLRGSWNLAGGTKLLEQPPPNADSGRNFAFGALAVCAHEGQFSSATATLTQLGRRLEEESHRVGVPLQQFGGARVAVHHSRDLDDVMTNFKRLGVRIVVVLLMEDTFYARVKFLADTRCLLTQCCRNSVVMKAVRGYETNLLIKMNAKMGGTNHALASRSAKGGDDDVFQKPPKSLSWVLDVPAMVIGIDVNHPEPHAGGSEAPSVVAVVASMDGMLSQYCAHITASSASREPVSSLYESFVRLIQTFCHRNAGNFPRHIIVYRDGVADSQFVATLDTELTALQQAIEHFGRDEDYVKIAFIVCQKRHHTRFFYKPPASDEYYNPCVGLCVDARGFSDPAGAASAAPASADADAEGCIVGSELVEFYLNSHAAVLGTSKLTRYVLLYDGIGFKLSELELFTFWLTHLYARCTRSVSIVAPAYYAHWAARRGRVLLTGSGGSINSAELKRISDRWLDGTGDAPASAMYFI